MCNQYARKLSRDGRAMPRLATSAIPDVYESMRSDEKKKWAQASAKSHFPAGIESRVLGSLAYQCKAICTGEITRDIQQLILQFGWGAILSMPFPENSKIPRRSRY